MYQSIKYWGKYLKHNVDTFFGANLYGNVKGTLAIFIPYIYALWAVSEHKLGDLMILGQHTVHQWSLIPRVTYSRVCTIFQQDLQNTRYGKILEIGTPKIINITQRAHDFEMTSYKGRCDVITSHRHQ